MSPVELVSWRAQRKRWTQWHISAPVARTRCGLQVPRPKPDFAVTVATRPATPMDWGRCCQSCREAVLRKWHEGGQHIGREPAA